LKLAKASTIEDMRARVAAAREAEEADETSPVEPEMPVINEPRELASTEYVNRAHTLDQSDLAMPRIMMAQAMSKAVQSDEVEKGNWYLYPDNMQLGEKIDVVLLNMFKSLLYFEPGQGLLCRSFDLVQGVGTPGIECDKCPLQKWLPKEEGGGPPKCRLAYNYTAMVVGSDINDESSPLMGVLSLSSMSAHGQAHQHPQEHAQRDRWAVVPVPLPSRAEEDREQEGYLLRRHGQLRGEDRRRASGAGHHHGSDPEPHGWGALD
jgi:hypothetical protein